MKQKSRTEYSVMNTTVAFTAQVAAILMGFFTRVVFTRTLSEGYVGINGLFTDILNILSLSELGVGTAITYALYGPIARNDIKKQQILMRMFRTFYRITAGVVLGAGLCLIPFLDILMKDRPDVDHLIVIYLLYLLNSVVSYLLIYKKTLVDAYQMNYITVMYHNGFLILQDLCQIIILLVTGNFILFLLDGSQPLEEEDLQIMELLEDRKSLILINKRDLGAVLSAEEISVKLPASQVIEASLLQGQGITEIEDAVEELVYGGEITQKESMMVNNVRHIELLQQGRRSLEDALQMTQMREALDFIEVDVKSAYEQLGEIIGETVSDDIINEVFARFCLGK